jgi:exonuclease VII small subunit
VSNDKITAATNSVIGAWTRGKSFETCRLHIAEIVEPLEAEIERLRKQLPEGMEGCKIILHQCEKGHSWLSAENWIQHGCPTCEIERLREVERLIKGLLTAGARKRGEDPHAQEDRPKKFGMDEKPRTGYIGIARADRPQRKTTSKGITRGKRRRCRSR